MNKNEWTKWKCRLIFQSKDRFKKKLGLNNLKQKKNLKEKNEMKNQNERLNFKQKHLMKRNKKRQIM